MLNRVENPDNFGNTLHAMGLAQCSNEFLKIKIHKIHKMEDKSNEIFVTTQMLQVLLYEAYAYLHSKLGYS